MAIETMTNPVFFFSYQARLEKLRNLREAHVDYTWKKEIFPIRISILLSRDLVFCFALGDPISRFELAPPSLLLQ